MSKVLAISGTINQTDSRSLEMMKQFLKAYKNANISDEIIYLDLNQESMAIMSLSSNNLEEFYNHENSVKYIQQLKSVDKVVIAAPMHNFKSTGQLVNYVDHIAVPNLTFSYQNPLPNGNPRGLLNHLKVQILATRGGELTSNSWADHTIWLKGVWEFMGATVAEPIFIGSLDLPKNYKVSAESIVKEYLPIIEGAAKNF
ncbi:FMN-dependent NADH-azoreductase [Mesoplasma syrphidae]|uniref:FMN dependent NADH:quinone oxidoreductase n=1 Tax=Mesoplasma syrphidae TaxID=225999 RepID=A0A2K9BZR3_9MOLU|nr:FMN-dependent NADH-azoreductase [Mesoplasma syrphidae]AUF83848.1 FMN-dependent NADH-azoreductase [Mesoplasma syrphidae]